MKQPKPEQYHEKKRHTEDQFPYNTYLCTIPDDFTEVPVHWHEEAEFIVIQKGSGTVFVDLTHYHVTAGDIKKAYDEGHTTVDAIGEATEAGTLCGGCQDRIAELLEEFAK